MARLLAIDYGRKRTGIAVSDPLQLIATGLTTIQSDSLLSWLKDYMQQEPVEKIIIGYPKTLRNEPAEAIRYINPVIKKIVQTFPEIPLVLMDERFTSKMAFQAMIDGGLKKKDRQDKAMIDKVSATILLQDFMSSAAGKQIP
ncbi:MAG: Holliday junction resolvase RuvX [Bacteroidales bacterium]|nr:Holliday junction resolvase RuvX [Bacteroidales bacterium]